MLIIILLLQAHMCVCQVEKKNTHNRFKIGELTETLLVEIFWYIKYL